MKEKMISRRIFIKIALVLLLILALVINYNVDIKSGKYEVLESVYAYDYQTYGYRNSAWLYLSDYFKYLPNGSDNNKTGYYYNADGDVMACGEAELEAPSTSGTYLQCTNINNSFYAVAGACLPGGELYDYCANWIRDNDTYEEILDSVKNESNSNWRMKDMVYMLVHYAVDRHYSGNARYDRVGYYWAVNTPRQQNDRDYVSHILVNFYNHLLSLSTASTITINGTTYSITNKTATYCEDDGIQRLFFGNVELVSQTTDHCNLDARKYVQDTDENNLDMYAVAKYELYNGSSCSGSVENTKYIVINGHACDNHNCSVGTHDVWFNDLVRGNQYTIKEASFKIADMSQLPSNITYDSCSNCTSSIFNSNINNGSGKCFYTSSLTNNAGTPYCLMTKVVNSSGIDYASLPVGEPRLHIYAGEDEPGIGLNQNSVSEYVPFVEVISNYRQRGGNGQGELPTACLPATCGSGAHSIVNYKSSTYCYSIKKVDDNNNPVQGSTWKMVGADQTVKTATTNQNGVATFTGLSYQNYKLYEDDAPSQYWNDNSAEEQISASSLGPGTNCPRVTKVDNRKFYCLRVKKVDENGNALEGAEFEAVQSGTTINKDSRDSNGHVIYKTGVTGDPGAGIGITSFFLGNNNATVTVTETKAPDGYNPDTSSKTYNAVALKEYDSWDAARTACLADDPSAAVASSGNTVAAETYNSNNGNNNYIYVNKKIKTFINWYKTAEDGTTLKNGAEFKIKNSSGSYIKLSSPVSISDGTTTKSCYVYTGTSTSGTTMTSGGGGVGQTCVSGLPAGTYTVEETKPLKYHTFGSSTTISLTTSETFAGMTNSNKFINKPTNFEFTKSVSPADGNATINVTRPDGTTGAITLNNLTTQELKKLKFIITESGSNIPLDFVYVTDHYEYAGNDIDPPTGTITTILQLNDNKKLSVSHLDAGKTYQIKEVESDGCVDAGNRTCNGYGYYYPNYSSASDYQFTVSNTYNSKSTQSLINTPTEITFTKKDLYGYLDADDIVKFENQEEINAFDQITFKLKDSNGNYLTLQKIGNSGSCNTNGSYAEYRYVPSDQSAGTTGTELHTCGGKIKITHLCRESRYVIEEVAVPTDTVFILTNPHPTVTYNIPKNAPASGSTSVTQSISDMPTRVKLTKVDSEAQTTPIDDSNVKFKVYRCASDVTTCTSTNGSLVYFTARATIANDTHDAGKEVYKYKGTTSGSGLVSEVSPYHGELILRYLPAGYKYTAVETGVPSGYYLAEGDGTQFTISSTSINNEKLVLNEHTKIEFEKQDIYGYYKKTDKAKMNDNTIIFDTIKFILRDKNGAQVSLKKVSDGNYKLSSVASENTVNQITTKNGKLTITHLKRGEKYYIEEVSADAAGNFVLPTNVTKPSGIPSGWPWAGHPFVQYTIENTKPANVQTQIMSNTPTRVVFVKLDTATQQVIDDQNITFKVYSCPKTQSAACTSSNGTLVNFSARAQIQGDQQDNGKEVYEYSKLNAAGVTELKLYNGELILRYLPAKDNKYVLVETEVADGYYKPVTEIEFTVNESEVNESAINGILTNVGNVPTEIYFTKKDLYGYVPDGDSKFDQISFKVKDNTGNYLTFTQVGTCTSTSTYAEYKYSATNVVSGGTELHTCKGKMKITYLNNNSTYKLEEVAVPSDSEFILPEPHPEVTYNIPLNEPEEAPSGSLSNMPTRVKLTKVDSEAQTTPIDDSNVKFKIYRCASNVSSCTSTNGTLVYFTARATLTNDTHDAGKEVYKYKGTTSGSGLVSELSPYHGELIIRYLPAGYKYTAVETGVPSGYYLAEGDGTQFTISSTSINNEKLVLNEHTKIEFEKQDIYGYYKKTDKAKMNDNTIIFDTIKFILRDKNGAQVSLKKVSDGNYKLSSVASENTVNQITTKNGKLTITHLKRGEKYYIEEVSADAAGNFVLPTNVTKPSGIPSGWPWAGHPFVQYTIENTKPANVQTQIMSNTPTRVVFVKLDTATQQVIDDQNITFKVYSCPKTQSAACTSSNGTLVNFSARAQIQGDQQDNGKEVYEYSKLNAAGVTELKLYNGELILRYLPAKDNKYVLVETEVADGYYKPVTEIEFTVNESEVNESAINGILTNVGNVPTEIYFTKDDLYGYADANSVVKFEDENERSAFDQITFKVKNNAGDYLSFEQVGTCTSTSEYAEYKYSATNVVSGGTELHTCKGKMKITYLNNNSTYKLEEVAVPDNTIFVLPEPHPEVTYNIPLNEPTEAPKATISDEPTRIVINKKYKNSDIHEAATGKKQSAQFEVYRCTDTSVACTYETSTKKAVRFTPITTVGSEYAYRFALNQSSTTNTITTLSLTTTGNKGQIVLRYLPANYRYVVVEKNAPDGYYNIEGDLADLDTIVPKNNTTSTYDRTNYATKIEFTKEDIYDYFVSSDLANAGDTNKIFDTMTFTLRNSEGNVVRLKEVTQGVYRFIQNDGSIPSGEGSTTSLHTKDGKLTITHLYRNEKYYIEEIETDTLGNFILPTNVTKPSGIPSGWPWAGHPYKAYDIPNTQSSDILINDTTPEDLTGSIENKPTRVIFEKRDERTGELINDETTRFEVYACDSNATTCTKNSGTKVFFEERTTINGLTDDITAVTPPVLTYKYKKLNANSGVSTLKTDRGVLSIAYLPSKYKYVLVETNAPNGYYQPVNGDEETEFDVESGTVIINSVKKDYEDLTEIVINKPTEIIFKKSDLYNYYSSTDEVDSNSNEYLLDTANFILRDESGNILSLRKTDTNNDEGNVYRYLEVNESNNIEYINTYKGKLKITNLYRSNVYYIEEVKTTDYEQFILPDYMTFDNLPFDNQGHPVVKYIVPNSAPENLASVTQEIKNIPTRVRFEKRDLKYGYLINDPTTTFKVYQCDVDVECHPSNYSTDEEREAAGIRLINFTSRSVIEGDQEDDGVEVYKYNKLNASGETELHPDKGVLVLRYLPSDSNYKYVLFETVAPIKYVLPEGLSAETEFTVVGTTTSVEEVDIPNSPTAIIIRKYADIEGDGIADDGNLLGGAKFKVYKVTNYNPNIKAKDQEREIVRLKTIKSGLYENSPVLDTDVITTCSGENCSYRLDSLGYDSSLWENIDDLIEKSGDDITAVLKEGTALIQYLDNDAYYVIEEVEAPTGYSLPEDDDNRFTLVHIKKNETEVLDTADALINKPTSFTFYKFDEYNTPLDGATFNLQKLDNDKKYNTLTVSKETLSNGNVIYRADENSELTDITTNEGHATVYYLEPGQYRIIEVVAPEGYELPKKTINVATFFVDNDGLVYGSNIISNKKPQEVIEYLASDKAELIINIQTGKVVIKYGLIITALIAAIAGLVIFLKKRK